MSDHVFGNHAFGMPVFDRPTIPMQRAGQLGPHFDVRPTPPDFPGASAAGFGSTAIPMQKKLPVGLIHAGAPYGPHFDVRPTPPNWPGASVQGLGDWTDLLSGVTGPVRKEIRKEAAAGAAEAVEPMVKKAFLAASVGVVISLVALFRR